MKRVMFPEQKSLLMVHLSPDSNASELVLGKGRYMSSLDRKVIFVTGSAQGMMKE